MSLDRPTQCTHCRTPLTTAQRAAGTGFCCTGCEVARSVLDGIVDARRFDALGGAPTPVAKARLDEGGLAQLQQRVPSAGRGHLDVDVEGVTCASCTWLVESIAKRAPGVAGATLNTALGRLSLTVDPAFDVRALACTLAQLGHAIGPARRSRDAALDELVARLGVTAALASAAMVFAFSFYFGLDGDDEIGRVFAVGQIVAGVLAVAVGGQPFFRAASQALRGRTLTMDVPIALGMVLALGASLASVASGGRGVYFDTVAVFVTLMLLGRVLERHVVERNRRLLLTHDADVADLRVRRLEDGRALHTPVSSLRIGDVLVIAPGELIPVDATLQAPVDGPHLRAVSRAWITGEPDASSASPGAFLAAGSHNADVRPLVCRVEAPFASSRLAALLAPPSARAADAFFVRLARAWVIGVFAVAAVAVALWWSAGAVRVLDVLAPLLVVTCPCAFGIAAPLAMERAHALLRQEGVFVRSPTFLARARRLRTVVFDKTGTLSNGELEVVDASALRALSHDERALLAALCGASNHPRSRAVMCHLDGVRPAAIDVIETAGVGVSSADGRARFVRNAGTDDNALVIDGVVRATVGYREQLRTGAADEVARLKTLGLSLYILSGDDAQPTRAMALRLGIPAEHAVGGLLPEQKQARVRALDHGDLLYVGDGLNDALAFEAATCAGTPAVDRPQLPERADFFLLGGTLSAIGDAVQGARRLRRVLVGLLTVATIYNGIVVGFGLLGALTPLSVALVMPLMSLSLVTAAVALVHPRVRPRLLADAVPAAAQVPA